MSGYIAVLCLGANGVHLSTHFLKKDGAWGGVKMEVNRGKPKDVFREIQDD